MLSLNPSQPFIPLSDSPAVYPSLAISTNAARALLHVLSSADGLEINILPSIQAKAWIAGVGVSLLRIASTNPPTDNSPHTHLEWYPLWPSSQSRKRYGGCYQINDVAEEGGAALPDVRKTRVGGP